MPDKYIVYEREENNIAYVRTIYHNPIPDFEQENGMYIESIPTAETPEGMYPVLMVNTETKELYYNYAALPEPPVTRDEIVEQVTELKQAIGELTIMIATPQS
ncbi:hypothetical protein J25TS5_14510 [Paenibacillus faecis]|uniref:hypothetical protein n=1 Tax=Paenibacillus faecis TaxID=862114 RepID=UPI001B244A00|nr:hypothetical protein [Paenibacillus faecis]GIO84519.1 hypothetical protein J25TS5_14510 [Paenibacillus faecis]